MKEFFINYLREEDNPSRRTVLFCLNTFALAKLGAELQAIGNNDLYCWCYLGQIICVAGCTVSAIEQLNKTFWKIRGQSSDVREEKLELLPDTWPKEVEVYLKK